MRRGGVTPNFGQRAKPDADLVELGEQVQQLARRAAEPIEPGDDDEITAPKRGNHLLELRAISTNTADLLAIDRGSAGGEIENQGFPRSRVIKRMELCQDRPLRPHN